MGIGVIDPYTLELTLPSSAGETVAAAAKPSGGGGSSSSSSSNTSASTSPATNPSSSVQSVQTVVVAPTSNPKYNVTGKVHRDAKGKYISLKVTGAAGRVVVRIAIYNSHGKWITAITRRVSVGKSTNIRLQVPKGAKTLRLAVL